MMRDLCDYCDDEADRGIHTAHETEIVTQLMCARCFHSSAAGKKLVKKPVEVLVTIGKGIENEVAQEITQS